MFQNKLHVFGCPFYWSFSLVLYSFFGVQTSVFIQNYVDFGRLSRYHHSFCPGMEIFCYWTLSTSVTGETSVLSAPNARVIKGGSGALLPRKKKIKIGLSETQLIHTSIFLSFQFSVSLFIIPVRCFQSHFKVKQIASYSTRSHSSSPANQSVFKCAIQLWLCNSVNITCTAIVFQAVLNISVTQNPLVRADRPKVPRKLQPSPNYGLKKF